MINVNRMDKYCVVCGKTWGRHMKECCTSGSLIAVRTVGIFRKKTQHFALAGNELTQRDIECLRGKVMPNPTGMSVNENWVGRDVNVCLAHSKPRSNVIVTNSTTAESDVHLGSVYLLLSSGLPFQYRPETWSEDVFFDCIVLMENGTRIRVEKGNNWHYRLTSSKGHAYVTMTNADVNNLLTPNPHRSAPQPADAGEFDKTKPTQGESVDNEADAAAASMFAAAANKRGNELHRSGDYKRAVESFTHAIKLYPKDPVPYFNRANSYSRMQQLELAFADYSSAIAIQNDYIEAYQNRAALCLQIVRPEQAAEDLTVAIRLAPNRGDLYVNRAVAYHMLGRPSHALRDLDEAIKLNADDKQALETRQYVLNEAAKKASKPDTGDGK